MKKRIDIKDLRKKLKLTQEELARELAVTVSTVNRWENGHSGPSKLALRSIDALCDKHKVVPTELPAA
ncbi:MAG TPA: helix-turn-helix domain-containing protein [Candidatus Binatia bacterium]|nr:helix-turn-helix domain-containing protein [Candidatus Binatia bacterium]